MLRKSLSAAAFAALLALAVTGCDGTTAFEDEPTDAELVQVDGKADSPVALPVGPFALESGSPGSFVELVLRADGVFRRSPLIACLVPPCVPPTQTGIYKTYWSKSTGKSYLRFYDASGKLIDSYSYTATPRSGAYQTALALSRTGTSLRFTMLKPRSSSGALEGEMCGGIAGLRCATSLRCATAAQTPDASGICSK